jgi:anti-anti-sigma factor
VGATLSYTTPSSVRVHGDLDFRSAPLVRDALVEAISQPLGEDVQVDLAGVTFLDCAGLGALIAASNAARTRARRIFVTNPSGAARRVLEICDLLTPNPGRGNRRASLTLGRAKQPRTPRGPLPGPVAGRCFGTPPAVDPSRPPAAASTDPHPPP